MYVCMYVCIGSRCRWCLFPPSTCMPICLPRLALPYLSPTLARLQGSLLYRT
ncbi:hypothetical protein LZ30DRAFT_705056 [Colletotrichum cereale]|nr:hypothetical protein LZ30DRAFT_705056 [Colletotrichum cereale]